MTDRNSEPKNSNQEKAEELLKKKRQEEDEKSAAGNDLKQEQQSIEDQARLPDQNNRLKPTVANRKQAGEDL